MRRLTWLAITVVLVGCVLMGGCQPRTIYVPHGEPVRLRQTLKSVKVWVLDADGKPVAGTMDLPEGWYCLPDPGEKD